MSYTERAWSTYNIKRKLLLGSRISSPNRIKRSRAHHPQFACACSKVMRISAKRLSFERGTYQDIEVLILFTKVAPFLERLREVRSPALQPDSLHCYTSQCVGESLIIQIIQFLKNFGLLLEANNLCLIYFKITRILSDKD